MMKRILAMLMALIMVFSVLPVGILAEGTDGTAPQAEQTTAEKHTLYTAPLVQHDHAASGDSHICEHCVAAGKTGADAVPAWTAWDSSKTTLPNTAGHYYLTGNMSVNAATLNSIEVVVCLNGYTVTAKSGQRFYTLQKGSKLTILDCTAHTVTPENEDDTGYRAGKLTGSTSAAAFMFENKSDNNAVLCWYDGILTGNKSGTGTAMSVQGTSDVYLYGGEFSYNTTTGGAPFYLSSANNTFYGENVIFTGNSAGGSGGVFAGYNAPVELKNCTFTGNSAGSNGGVFCNAAVNSNNGLKITATDCTFTGNSAGGTGGVYFGRAGFFKAYNCTFTKNSANAHSVLAGGGGGVQVLLDSCRITENTSASDNGAVFVPNSSTPLTVSGNTYIYGNTRKGGLPGNVHLQNDSNGNYPVLTVSGLTTGAKIGINLAAARMENSTILSKSLNGALTQAQVSAYFVSDDADYRIDLVDDKLKLVDKDTPAPQPPAPTHVHNNCLKTDCSLSACTGHSSVGYMEWTDPNALPTSGSYYLAADVTLNTQPVLTTGTLNLCLNGKTVTVKGNRFAISGDAVLNITDCTAKTENGVYTAGKLTGAAATVFYMTGDSSGKLSSVNLFEGILTGNNRTTYHASVAYIQSGASLNMFGGEISGNTVGGNGTDDRGGTIYIHNSKGTFNLYGGKITDNTAKKAGGKGGNGAAVYNNGGTVNLLGGEVSNNIAEACGGAIYSLGGTVTMGGCTITGNKAATGGAIYCKNGVKLTDNGSVISNNTASGGGGAFYGHGGSIKLVNTKVTGNTANQFSAIQGGGGGVQITLDGAELTGNKATSAGTTYGAVYIPNNGAKIIVQGAAKVENNEGGNVYLAKDSNTQNPNHPMITLGANGLSKGAHIGITMPADRLGAEPYASLALGGKLTSDQVAEYFFCDNDRYAVSLKEDRLHIAKFYLDIGHKHCACTDSVGSCDHKDINYIAWDDPTTLPTSGNYCLVVDVKTTANISLTGSDVLNLCLNGHTIEAAGSQEGTWRDRIFDIKGESTLNLTDCTGNGKLTGGTYGVILFEDNQNSKTVLNMYGGHLTGNRGLSLGGAVLIQGGGTFNMYGGSITENSMNGQALVDAEGKPVLDEEGNQQTTGTSNGGGAIGLNGTKATFNMYGGKIAGNECLPTTYLKADGTEGTVAGRGGAIYSTRGTVNIYGGEISGNEAGQGGAIYAVIYSKVNIAGGLITQNTTSSHGGGIFADNCTVTVTDGKITGNTAGGQGGGIQNSNGKAILTVSGGEITGNVGNYGGGIMNQGRATIIIEGGLIARNSADTAGGVYISTLSPAKMTGGTITGNTAVNNAGGLYILRNTLDFTGGEITKNTAGREGGGMFVYGATLNLDGGVIKNNTAEKNGGGLSTGRLSANVDGVMTEFRPTVNIISGSIEGNTAKGAGGGMLVQGYATLNISGGEIKNNTSKSNGGGAYASSNTTLEMTGGTVSGNKAGGTGGGMYVLNAKANFAGGVFEKNKTDKQGGGICTSHSEIKLSGVKIRNHNHKGVGAGYTGFNSNTVMTGGSITGNHAESYGGGMYLQRGKLTVYGGSISYNTTKGNGAGVYLAGINANIYGGSMIGNKCEGSGGGALMTHRWNYTENGVKKMDKTVLTVTGGTFSENYGRNGGAFLIQSDATIKVSGGTFTKNEGPSSGGALFISTNCKYEITGGTFTENKTNVDGGALNLLNSQGVIDGESGKLVITGNYAKRYGGGLNITGELADALVCNLKISDNSVSNRGGGIAVNTKAHANFENVEICNNHSEIQGGGFYVGHAPVVTMKNSKLHSNTSEAAGAGIATECVCEITLENVEIFENETKTKAGGIYTRAAEMHLINCHVHDNVAGGDGGGIATAKLFGRGGEIGSGGKQEGLILENTTVKDNTCVGAGGGIHINSGHYVTIIDSQISGNTAGLEGSGIWAMEHLKMDGMTVTGNTSKNNGYAVYIADATYDGQSYVQALLEMGGDIIVKDNQGGEMYMGAMNAISITAEGLGQNTEFNITLDTATITNRILGSYHYEGENGVYTVTYGTRSLTEPQTALEPRNEGGNVLLYVGVGAVGLAAVAVLVLLVLKKKKKTAGEPAESSVKE